MVTDDPELAERLRLLRSHGMTTLTWDRHRGHASGYDVVAAEDGATALDLLERGQVRPDLIVTDVIMPGRNGRQLHDAVAARWPGLPVLFMSGHTGEEAVLQRLVPRGAPFLQKPFSPEALARTAGELLAARPRRR